MMRDPLCNEQNLKNWLAFNERDLRESYDKIEMLKDDIVKGIQRYPYPPEKVIYNTRNSMVRTIKDFISIKYSLGLPCDELEELYEQWIPLWQEVGFKSNDFLNWIKYFSLGILLEVPRAKMQILVDLLDDAKGDDILLDYLICAYGLKRKKRSTHFDKEIPYRQIIEIAKVAKHDKKKASALLMDYTEKKYIKGHADCYWPTLHKKPAMYYGLWSYEAGAVAKILQLDDSGLVHSNHYPYDLAHYKNSMKFNQNAIDEIMEGKPVSDKDCEWYAETIPMNHELESIIPGKFRGLVNQVIADYEKLSEKDFYDKYELKEIWFAFENFSRENKKGLLGTLLVFILTDYKYILQLDYKEDPENYKDQIVNCWKNAETVLIRFELDNDQMYFARVPKNFGLKNLYEVKIEEVML